MAIKTDYRDFSFKNLQGFNEHLGMVRLSPINDYTFLVIIESQAQLKKLLQLKDKGE